MPYEEPFESYANGTSAHTINGWVGAENAANISTDPTIIAKMTTYISSGGSFPISDATHDKILCVKTGNEITVRILDTNTTQYLDFLWFPGRTYATGVTPEVGTNDQLAIYVDDASRQLRIWHDDTGTPEFLTLSNSPTIGTCEWVRVTIEQNYIGNRYQMRVNEDDPIMDAKGWDAPSGGGQPGTWFNMVKKSGFLRKLVAIPAVDPTYMDDFQVQLEDPLVVSTFGTWVAQFNLPPGQGGPNDDPDGDGASNLEEWIAGTGPSDPHEVFEIVTLDFLNGSNCIQWQYGTNTEITTPFILWRTTNEMGLVYEAIASGIPRDPSGFSLYYDTNPPALPALYRTILPTNHP